MYKVILLSDADKKIQLHFGYEYFYKILPDTETLCRKFRYKKDAQMCLEKIEELGGAGKIQGF